MCARFFPTLKLLNPSASSIKLWTQNLRSKEWYLFFEMYPFPFCRPRAWESIGLGRPVRIVPLLLPFENVRIVF